MGIWKEISGTLERRVSELSWMLVGTLGEYCDFDLYIIKYHPYDPMVEVAQRSKTLSVLECSLYRHFNVHMKPAYKNTSQKRR